MVRSALAGHGHPLAQVNVTLHPDAATRLVRLAVSIVEGPQAVLGAITIKGNRRNSREDILACTGLAEGMELTPALLARARLALWNSARFFEFDINPHPRGPQTREVDVTIDLDENDARPPLREPLPRHEAALVRFANWMTTDAAARGFAIVGRKDDAVPFTIATSPKQGLALDATAANGARLAVVVGPTDSGALATANGKIAVRKFGGLTSRMTAYLHLLTHADVEKNGRRSDLGFGANWSSDANDGQFVNIELIISPAFVCHELLKDSTPGFDAGDVVLLGADGKSKLRFRESSGELVEWCLAFPDESKNQAPASEFEFRSGRADFERIQQALAAGRPAADAPRVSLTSLIFAHPLVAKFLAENPAAADAKSRLAKWKLGALLVEHALAAWAESRDPTSEPDFTIPVESAAARPEGITAMLAATYYKWAMTLWPADAWPGKLARELFYIATDQTKYTSAVMEELLRDPTMGPVGSLLAAQLLRTLDPLLASQFAQRAIDRSSADDFRRDWQLLLDSRFKAGRIAQDIVRALADMDDHELDGIAAALPDAESAVLKRGLTALRTGEEQALVKIIQPALDEWWSQHARHNLAAQIVSLFPELPPIGPLGYSTRGELRMRGGDAKGAMADFNQALALDPKFVPAHVNRGHVRITQGDFNGALSDLNRAVELDARLGVAYFNRGIAWFNKRNSPNALADFDRAIELNPNHAAAYHHRGYVKLSQRDIDGTIADYERAAALDPKNATIYNDRGFVRQTKGDLDGAIADFSKAIELNPNFALAYANRGKARKAKGDTFGAMADLDKSFQLRSPSIRSVQPK